MSIRSEGFFPTALYLDMIGEIPIRDRVALSNLRSGNTPEQLQFLAHSTKAWIRDHCLERDQQARLERGIQLLFPTPIATAPDQGFRSFSLS